MAELKRMQHARGSGPVRRAACLLAAAGLAGCNLAPKYHVPATEIPASFKESSDWKLARPGDGLPRGPWWAIYQDPELDALETRVSAANQDLKAAVAQFQQARAIAQQAQSAFYPTLSAGTSASRNQLSRALANPLPHAVYNDYQLNLDLSYEIDVWGRVRNAAEAGKDRAAASAGDLATMDLSLHAELAIDYFTLRGDDAEQHILDQTVRDYEKALELTVNRYKGGWAADADVSEAKTQLELAETQDTNTSLLRSQLEHAIAVLVGVAPAQFSLPVRPLAAKPPPLDVGLPGLLLERRPDIAAAERRAAAANADVGVARAAYFPTFNLNALVGVESATTGSLFTSPALAWMLGPSGVVTIFDNGLREALNAQARAAYEQTAAEYRQTVLHAYQEVEDNLAALGYLQREDTTQSAAVSDAAHATLQAERRYEGGLANYFEVVTAQNAELAARLSEMDIEIRRMSASVTLIEALGGGWRPGCAIRTPLAATCTASMPLSRAAL